MEGELLVTIYAPVEKTVDAISDVEGYYLASNIVNPVGAKEVSPQHIVG